MKLFPAIDLREGRVVRLFQGDYQNMTVYEQSPLEAAQAFESAGATALHTVDLDGARDGKTVNRESICRIARNTGLFVEVGGGIRDEKRIVDYLEAGVGRVIIGSAALEQPDFVKSMAAKYGERIAVGIDARDGRVAIHGWLDVSGQDSVEFCEQMRDVGVRTVIYTDIACDGTLQGTNMEIYRRLTAMQGLSVVASGGISSYEELKQLRRMGAAGAILGKALYSGKLELGKALAAAEGET